MRQKEPEIKPQIRIFSPDDEYFFVEGCHIIELSNQESDPALSIARARVAPGVTTKWHSVHQTVERYVILEGKGRAEVGDLAPQQVLPGDVVIIPPDCPQRITNTGTSDLIFIALCTPRFLPENYRDLE
jgi:mannose-6-phosphate isomerase-like protein (cupin superfamily)